MTCLKGKLYAFSNRFRHHPSMVVQNLRSYHDGVEVGTELVKRLQSTNGFRVMLDQP